MERGSDPAPPTRARPAETGGVARTLLARARQHGLDPLLVKAVILTESAGRRRARSPKGAMGLMQLMPATARRFGVADPDDPAQNIAGGTRYLRWLLDRFGGNVTLALAGYNAGEGAVDRHGGIPPYRETRHYVRRVRATHAALGRILTQKRVRAGE
jgi:soluble lytic murein transglycosylase-like protein